jgi:hypothetical protein
MELPSVVTYLNMHLDLWCCELSCFSSVDKKMDKYRQTSNLIKGVWT